MATNAWEAHVLLGENLLEWELAEPNPDNFWGNHEWVLTNPTYSETSKVYWFAGGSPVEEEAWERNDPYVYNLRVSAVGASSQTLGVKAEPGVGIRPGTTAMSAGVWAENGYAYSSRTCTVGIVWHDVDGTVLSTSRGSAVTLTTTHQRVVVENATVPSGAALAKVLVEFDGSHADGDDYQFTRAQIVVGSAVSTWTDISSYVEWEKAFSITRGRSDAHGEVQPGRLSGLVLDNSDGRFTVGNASGAYGAQWRLGVPLRIRVQSGSTWYTQFIGRLDSAPIHWENAGNDRLVTASATDLSGDWFRADWPAQDMIEWMLANNVSEMNDYGFLRLWSFTSIIEDAVWSTDGDYPLTREATAPTVSKGSGHPSNGRATTAFDTGSGRFVGALPSTSSGGWWLSFWIRMLGTPSTAYGTPTFLPVMVKNSSTGEGVAIHPCKDGQVGLTWINSSSVATDALSSDGPWGDGFNDGQWHYVVISAYDNSGTATVQAALDSEYWGNSTAYDWDLDGNPDTLYIGPSGGTSDPFEVAYVCFGDWEDGTPRVTVSAAIVAEQQGIEQGHGMDMMNAMARFAGLPRVGESSGFDQARYVNTGPLPLTLKPMDMVRQIAATDGGGALWATRKGGLSYDGQPLYGNYGASSVAVTLTSQEVGALTLEIDSAAVVNRVTVTNVSRVDPLLAASGPTTRVPRLSPVTVTFTLEDTESRRAVGARDKSISTYIEPTSRWTRAGWMATIAEMNLTPPEPRPRVPEIVVDCLTLPTEALRADMMACDLFQWVAVTTPDDERRVLRIEGISISVGARHWTVRFNLSPAGFLLNDSTYGLLDGTNYLCQ